MSMKRTRVALAATAVVATLAGLAALPSTTAAFVDSTFARADMRSEVPLTPVRHDQSAGTGLFLTPYGDLYVSGQRQSGNGAGGTATASDQPNKVTFPAGTEIVDAIGSSEDFMTASLTSWAAIDATGRIWTWGFPASEDYLGRGDITLAQSRTPGLVVARPGSPDLPRFIDLARTENQFLALDEAGQMWAWGYHVLNLPLSTPNVGGISYPTVVDQVAVTTGDIACTGANAGGFVRWHSIWSGNHAGAAVSRSGLVYTWGFDHGRLDGLQVTQRCPILNEQANRALFQAYPTLYTTATGESYDERVLTTEAARLARYTDIVRHVSSTTLPACSASVAKDAVDESGCPVRQFGYSARAPWMLLGDGTLYTWQVSTDHTWGGPFLGRTSTSEVWSVDGSRYKATVALRGVSEVAVGIGHARALMTDGTVLGWGRNSVCQATGAHADASTPCTTRIDAEVIALPTAVRGQPTGISRLLASACVSWLSDSDGSLWASGAGSDSGGNYVFCGAFTPGAVAYDQTPTHRTPENPYGLRATTNMSLQRMR